MIIYNRMIKNIIAKFGGISFSFTNFVNI